MERRELLELALDLATECGIEVRREPAGAPVHSGVCRVRDAVWIVLSGGDPVEEHLAVALEALGEHAGEGLADRYVAPALRELLDAAKTGGVAKTGGADEAGAPVGAGDPGESG